MEQFTELNWNKIINGYKFSIIGIGIKPANQFTANPYNPKIHPKEQREAVDRSLEKFGWVGFVIENRNTGNVLDGHDRILEAMAKGEETLVPYILVDVPLENEAEFLIMYDKTTFMSMWDSDILREMRENGLLDNTEREFKINDLFDNLPGIPDIFTEREPKDEREERVRGGNIIYFFFDDHDEFKRVHKELLGYDFDGEGESVSVPGEILSKRV